MTTTANPLLENCCNSCCEDGGCSSVSNISIESTKPECLSVDTSECGVVKLTPACPPVVVAGENVTVTTEDCEDGESCSTKYIVNADCSDELVKACPDDTTPGTLSEKLEAGTGITITENGCGGGTNSSLVISVDKNNLNLSYPPIVVRNGSNLITVAVTGSDGHTLAISDNHESTYDNMCCIGFVHNKEFTVSLDSGGNSEKPLFMGDDQGNKWDIFTGNSDMATSRGIKILADGYYRLFGQITVENNIDDNFHINLGRGLLKITGDRFPTGTFLSTAKHGGYARQILLEAGSGIDITNEGEISSGSGNGQTDNGFNGPWMTFNIDTLVDLKKGDIITIGYRPQSNNARNTTTTYRLVGQDDGSYSTFEVLFGGTLLGVYQLAPKRFQKNSTNQIYEQIGNA